MKLFSFQAVRMSVNICICLNGHCPASMLLYSCSSKVLGAVFYQLDGLSHAYQTLSSTAGHICTGTHTYAHTGTNFPSIMGANGAEEMGTTGGIHPELVPKITKHILYLPF